MHAAGDPFQPALLPLNHRYDLTSATIQSISDKKSIRERDFRKFFDSASMNVMMGHHKAPQPDMITLFDGLFDAPLDNTKSNRYERESDRRHAAHARASPLRVIGGHETLR